MDLTAFSARSLADAGGGRLVYEHLDASSTDHAPLDDILAAVERATGR